MRTSLARLVPPSLAMGINNDARFFVDRGACSGLGFFAWLVNPPIITPFTVGSFIDLLGKQNGEKEAGNKTPHSFPLLHLANAVKTGGKLLAPFPSHVCGEVVAMLPTPLVTRAGAAQLEEFVRSSACLRCRANFYELLQTRLHFQRGVGAQLHVSSPSCLQF